VQVDPTHSTGPKAALLNSFHHYLIRRCRNLRQVTQKFKRLRALVQTATRQFTKYHRVRDNLACF